MINLLSREHEKFNSKILFPKDFSQKKMKRALKRFFTTNSCLLLYKLSVSND